MKRFLKVIVNLIAVALLVVSTLGLFACEDLVTMEIKFNVYDTSSSQMTEKTVSAKLYRHLAGDTVDAIAKLAKDGYYNDAVFYKSNATDSSNNIFFGDLKFVDGEIVEDVKPFLKNSNGDLISEFEAGGVKGSDLLNIDGYLGLWRTWKSSYSVSNSLGTGNGVLYIPTSSNTSLDGYFCVFGKLDLDNEDVSNAYSSLKAVLSSSQYYVNYTVYYTGEYDETKQNCGLTFHAEKTDDFNLREDVDELGIFEPKTGKEYQKYAQHTINLPFYNGQVCASIKSVTIK